MNEEKNGVEANSGNSLTFALPSVSGSASSWHHGRTSDKINAIAYTGRR